MVLSISLLLSVLVAPPTSEAQSERKSFRVGWLGFSSAGPVQGLMTALRQALRAHGWIEGQNLSIEFRWAEGQAERLPGLAAELVSLKVDIIMAATEPAILAAKRATSTIPIVMTTAADPVGSGLVDGLARPGGNITGLTFFAPDLAAKRLQLLRDVVPRLSRVAVLWNADNSGKAREAEETRRAAERLQLQFVPFEIRGPGPDLNRVFVTMAARTQAAIILGESLTFNHRTQIQALAASKRLPTIYETRGFLDAGGLMSYGPDVTEMYRRAAYYVDRILRGAKPGDLPIEEPSKIELVINLKTVSSIGLTIPHSLLVRADELIR
jgi:putative ABC transport system substrate-binding protein